MARGRQLSVALFYVALLLFAPQCVRWGDEVVTALPAVEEQDVLDGSVHNDASFGNTAQGGATGIAEQDLGGTRSEDASADSDASTDVAGTSPDAPALDAMASPDSASSTAANGGVSEGTEELDGPSAAPASPSFERTRTVSAPALSLRTHVQKLGWQAVASERAEEGVMSGTTGKGLRLEALELSLSGVEGGIEG